MLLFLALGSLVLSACEPASPAPTIQIRAADGAEMVLVPAGPFLMGSDDSDPKAGDDEKPQHTVSLEAFWIDRLEVTSARYARFLNALGEHRGACGGHDCIETQEGDPDSHIYQAGGRYAVPDGYEQHPVIEVTWFGALAYCEWAGARLPTEAEWEKAARGERGALYPWGDGRPDCDRAQYGDCAGSTVTAGSRPAGASPYGALDMAGNVWEWVADWYEPAYYATSPARNPAGPEAGLRAVFRGGSWGYPAAFVRAAERARNRPSYAGFNVGFRCASSL